MPSPRHDNGTIVWFRQDLRLRDNPALRAACDRGGWVLPLYILTDDERDWALGGASRWWLHQSLTQLAASLDQRGSRLIFLRGDAETLLPQLSADTGAAAVYWNRRYEPAVVERDARIKSALRDSGVACESFNGALLGEPWEARSPTDKPYRVFTPFKKRLLERLQVPPAAGTPRRIAAPDRWPRSQDLKQLGLMPRISWYRGMAEHWRPGETGALRRARRFLTQRLRDYGEARNRPDTPGTSELSPHLHFGEISVRELWRLGEKAGGRGRRAANSWQESVFASELVWREFAHHLLCYFPRTPLHPLDTRFERFAWQPDKKRLHAWQRGLTGFPIVDAGMRQLWSIGWMHNRVRMIVASLLVKNLQQPWLDGAHWFWDTLVDADLAANTLNWQWTAGCGADAAPYFRVFNPVTQGEKFDPDGEYVRRWVPELARLPAKYIHAPQLAPAEVLHAARVRLGNTYPLPLVDLKASRQEALQAYDRMRQG
jgi:deoxyribodipyrimidine photo-lyase